MSLWLRLYTEALHDPKVQRLPAPTFKGWVNLLMLAKERDGVLPDAADIAFTLRLSDRQADALVSELLAVGLLDRSDDGLTPHNWQGRQYDSDDTAERARRYRQRQRDTKSASPVVAEADTHHVTANVLHHVTAHVNGHVPEKETERETERETDHQHPDRVLMAATPQTIALMNDLRGLPHWPKTLSASVLRRKVEQWQAAYPDVDIGDELRRMDSWLLGKPQRKANVAFVENWLRKAKQDGRDVGRRTGTDGHGGRPDRASGTEIWAEVALGRRTREDAEREFADAWARAQRGEL